jgi:hypothetical protein
MAQRLNSIEKRIFRAAPGDSRKRGFTSSTEQQHELETME